MSMLNEGMYFSLMVLGGPAFISAVSPIVPDDSSN